MECVKMSEPRDKIFLVFSPDGQVHEADAYMGDPGEIYYSAAYFMRKIQEARAEERESIMSYVNSL
jgi:hypothetical protein